MYRSLTFTIIALFFYVVANAQQTSDSLYHRYNNETIFRYGSSFKKGTERLTFPELQHQFSQSSLGLEAYRKARKQKTTATIFRVAAFASMITALVLISDRQADRDVVYSLIGGQVVLGLVSGQYEKLSRESVDRSLWQRNKDLLFPGR